MRPLLLALLLPAACAAQGWQSIYSPARPGGQPPPGPTVSAEALGRAEARVAELERQVAELRAGPRAPAADPTPEPPPARLARLRAVPARLTVGGRPTATLVTVGEYLDKGGPPEAIRVDGVTADDIAFLARSYPPAQGVPARPFPGRDAGGALPHNPTHTCPSCGTTSPAGSGTWVVRGHLPNGEHVHTCPNCGQSWSH